MRKEHCLKLCLAVYKVTKPFPEEEPLKFNIRKRVNNILVKLISCNPTATLSDKKTFSKDVEVLNAYFGIAAQQNWVNPENFVILQREFNKLSQEFSGENKERDRGGTGEGQSLKTVEAREERKVERGMSEGQSEEELQKRQKKILEIIKQKQECQISEFEDIFQGTSRRTIQRDLEFLVQRGLIKRQGENRDIFYKFV